MKNDSIVELSPPKPKIRVRTGIQVIARAAAVLRTLRNAPEGLSLGEIAKTLDMPKSTIQRIVEALDHEDLVIAAFPNRGVRLGPALLDLAEATRFEIADVARSTVQTISKECGETVAISILNGSKVVFVDHVSGTHHLRVEPPPGESLPAQSTAPGKAILAAMPSEALNRLRRRFHFEQLTPNTIISWDDLLCELARVRESGVAYDLEEVELGVSAIAVVVVLPNKELAAISIPVPTQRFAEEKTRLVEILMTHCAKLQQTLSGERH